MIAQSVSQDDKKFMPVAVVGMSCRLSGIATDPEGLWQMLSKGLTGWSKSAGERFKLDSFWHPKGDTSGSFNARGLHLLKQDPALFDNDFFGINNVEAKAIDPQQRLLLEVAYEAFENAGFPKEKLEGSDTGVYCAVSNHDYEAILGRDPELSPTYRFTGTGSSLVSNRISYVWDLHGPSITLDTACSGGLVAVHEACKAIRAGEITQALVGGTNLILDPDMVSTMASLQVLSSHGRCYAFDSRADGFGRGEGLAAIVLKPLDAALRDGDAIRAVIRGSAVSQDGRTAGITMPSKDAQAKMIRKAYETAGLALSETVYVEAHGTGTKAGDKTEAEALYETFGQEKQPGQKLFVGSVKANVGHTESVAGLAGVVKAILVLEKGFIPPNVTFSKPADNIPLENWGIEIPKRLIKWPENAVKRASINSFGYGGTNAHVILDAGADYVKISDPVIQTNHILSGSNNIVHSPIETDILRRDSLFSNVSEYSAQSANGESMSSQISNSTATSRHSSDAGITNGITKKVLPTELGTTAAEVNVDAKPQPRLFALSHAHEQGMSNLATRLIRFLRGAHLKDSDSTLDDLAFTMSNRRSQLSFRTTVTATTRNELLDGLEEIVKGTVRPQKSIEQPSVCFAFTGQGAQWAQMGRELLEEFPVFSQSMNQSEAELVQLGADWYLITELNKDKESSRINEAVLSQPCCTAIQIALVDLLHSFGIRPEVVCGHSSGEIAAAYAAGFINFADAIKIAFHRGAAVQSLKQRMPELNGGMMAVGLSPEKAQEYLSTLQGKVGIACINSPNSVTLSGDKPALLEIQESLNAEQVFNRMLLVDVAYHSHHMELIRSEYVDAIQGIRPLASEGVKMISSVTGQEICGGEMESTYWGQNLVSPVRFAESLIGAFGMAGKKTAFDDGVRGSVAIIEIGPHSALAGPIKQTVKSLNSAVTMSYNSALVRSEDARKTTLAVAGDLFSRGVSIDFEGVNNPNRTASKQVLSNLPTYSWQHNTRHWNETRISAQYRQRKFPKHDLLGVPLRESISTEPSWRNFIRTSDLPWLSGHCFTDQIVYPAAGYISAVLEALRYQAIAEGRLWKNLRILFRQVNVGRALLISDDSIGVEMVVSLRPYAHSVHEASASWKEFHIFSTNEKGEATEHCSGLVRERAAPEIDGQKETPSEMSETKLKIEETRRSARTPIQPSKLYNELKAAGIEYSGPFQSLENIRACPTRSLSQFKIPNIKLLMPAEHQQPHCLHPVTLDLCFQTIFPVFKAAGQITPVVVSMIEELEISSDICSQPGTELVVATHHKHSEHSNHFAEMIVTDQNGTDDSSVIHIKGIVFTTSDGVSQSNLYRNEQESLCYKVEWALDASCADSKSITDLCNVVHRDSLSLERRQVYDEFCQRAIRETLANFSAADEANVKGHMTSLLQWMRSEDVSTAKPLDDVFTEKAISYGVQGEALLQVRNNFSDILTGQVDPLSVLLQNDLLYRVYSNSNTDNCNTKLAQYAKLLQFKNPNMRILEIGAGTASTSLPVLEALYAEKRKSGLAKIDRFVFTDISSGFFENARSKLEMFHDVLDFKKLDIESAPDQQGFELGSFDLIIASNVLHATKRMSNTMKNVKSLLKPGGKLALIEITNPSLCWKMVFGTLPGWWLGEEEGRNDSPLLTTSKWNDLLLGNGFTGIDIEMGDFETSEGQELSVMVSTAKSNINETKSMPVQVLCSDAEYDIVDNLTELLKKDDLHVQVEKVSLTDVEPTGSVIIVLLEALHPILTSCTQESWDKITNMFSTARGILWVTKGGEVESIEPHQATIVGLSRTIRSENHSLKLVTVDLEPHILSHSKIATQVATIYKNNFGRSAIEDPLSDLEYAVRNGKVLIPRLLEDVKLDHYVKDTVSQYHPHSEPLVSGGRALGLKINSPGSLDTFYWADSQRHSTAPAAHEVRVELQYIALNFKDLMIAMDQLQGHTAMLIEGSGTVVDVGESVRHKFSIGDSVTVFGHDSLATTCNVEHWNVHHVPKTMSMELAASVTVAYSTALYAFKNVARLQEGESVLIHSAAGAVGQAAVALAQYLKAGEIYITVGSEEKRTFMRENFGIPEDHIFSSRDLLFGEEILRKTKGRGVDVLLNSLTGDALRENCAIIAPFGRFVEIGKKDLISNARLEMQYLEKNITFSAIDLAMVAKEKPKIQQELLESVFKLMESERLKVLSPITVKPVSELEDTFRMMQAGKHMGKLVLRIEPNMQLQVQPSKPSMARLSSEFSYLVAGGTGGLGRAIIRYLAQLGAKHIVTMSRSGSENEKVKSLQEELSGDGVELIIHKGSVLEKKDIQLIKELTKAHPIRGIIQGAMVLQDSTVNNMTYSQWRAALEPKVNGTWNLHSVLGYSLDFFILLSSVAGTIGSSGQGNYCAGNSFQDSFARFRASLGLPVRTIDVGLVEGEGYTADNEDAAAFIYQQGIRFMKLSELFAVINHAIAYPVPENVAASQAVCGVNRADPTSDGEEAAQQRPDPRFSHMWSKTYSKSNTNAAASGLDVRSTLKSAKTPQEATDLVQSELLGKLCRLLAMPFEDIHADRSVASYGVDSLIAVELRNWLSKQLETHVQTFELLSPTSISQLAAMIAKRSRLIPPQIFQDT